MKIKPLFINALSTWKSSDFWRDMDVLTLTMGGTICGGILTGHSELGQLLGALGGFLFATKVHYEKRLKKDS
jgi:hypothetical protein